MTPAAEFDAPRARRLALAWLARREYGRNELQQKLRSKGCPEAIAMSVTVALAAENLLSDERLVESLVRVRRARGFGPLRIQMELERKGIEPEMVECSVDFGDCDWIELARRARGKRFGDRMPESPTERARQMRFLQQRGFTFAQIRRALDACVDDV